MVPLLTFYQAERAPQQVGAEANVRVGENQPLPGCVLISRNHRVGLAKPAFREFPDVDDFEILVLPGELVQDLRGGITRPVVYHNDLVTRIILGEQSGEGLRKAFGFVPRGDKNRDAGAIGVRQQIGVCQARHVAYSREDASGRNYPEEGQDAEEHHQDIVHALFDHPDGGSTGNFEGDSRCTLLASQRSDAMLC